MSAQGEVEVETEYKYRKLSNWDGNLANCKAAHNTIIEIRLVEILSTTAACHLATHRMPVFGHEKLAWEL